MDDREARERVARVDALLGEVEELPAATELIGALLDLYGEGLARIAARCDAAALADDELVAHLLLLHGLHPVPLEARVRGALDEVRPYLESHGGDVELVGVSEGVVRLRMQGSCNGCPSSSATLKLAIEEAIQAAAPDVAGIEAEGVPAAQPAPGLLALEVTPAAERAWSRAGVAAELDGRAPAVREVAGEPVLFVRLGQRPYAYRPACPGCGASLDGAALVDGELRCGGCGHRYDVRHAGRCLDAPRLHLDPVPLLVDADGGVKVALGVPA